LSISRIAKSLLVSAAFSLATVAAHAEGIGASLLTQQHPFYNELAKAMTAEAKAKNVRSKSRSPTRT
jgi:ribose transport system substrate-binding protein